MRSVLLLAILTLPAAATPPQDEAARLLAPTRERAKALVLPASDWNAD